LKSLIKLFKPSEEGLRQILGELESEIMEIVWLKKEASVRDVLLELKKSKEIAYTTVMTVMVRLHEKGFIERNKDGQAFIYCPKISKEKLKEDTVKNVLRGIMTESSNMAMTHFVDEMAKDPENLKQLQTLIKERLSK
jgi:predicted transcriptional regulator